MLEFAETHDRYDNDKGGRSWRKNQNIRIILEHDIEITVEDASFAWEMSIWQKNYLWLRSVAWWCSRSLSFHVGSKWDTPEWDLGLGSHCLSDFSSSSTYVVLFRSQRIVRTKTVLDFCHEVSIDFLVTFFRSTHFSGWSYGILPRLNENNDDHNSYFEWRAILGPRSSELQETVHELRYSSRGTRGTSSSDNVFRHFCWWW